MSIWWAASSVPFSCILISCTPLSGCEAATANMPLSPMSIVSTALGPYSSRSPVSLSVETARRVPFSCIRISCTARSAAEATSANVAPSPISNTATPWAPPSLSNLGEPWPSAAHPDAAITGAGCPWTSMPTGAGRARAPSSALPSASRIAAPPPPLPRTRAESPARPGPAAESPGCTAYAKSSLLVPLPPAYEAPPGRSASAPSSHCPSSRPCTQRIAPPGRSIDAPSAGSPSTTTGSSNATVMSTMCPVPYVPPGLVDVTPTTAGAAPSTAMSRLCPSDPGSPGAGRARTALAPPCASRRIDAAPPRDRASAPA